MQPRAVVSQTVLLHTHPAYIYAHSSNQKDPITLPHDSPHQVCCCEVSTRLQQVLHNIQAAIVGGADQRRFLHLGLAGITTGKVCFSSTPVSAWCLYTHHQPYSAQDIVNVCYMHLHTLHAEVWQTFPLSHN
jgi:hypothetical protein